MGLGVCKFISLEENCVFPRPLWALLSMINYLVMLNLVQHLTNLALYFFSGKIPKLVRDDILFIVSSIITLATIHIFTYFPDFYTKLSWTVVPLWERAGERGQAGLGKKKFSSLDEVFLYSSLFNPQAPLPEIRDFDPPTRGGLSLITWSLDHPVTSPKDCRGAATLRNASNKRTLHSSRLTLHSLLEKLKRSYKFLITWSLDHLVTSRNKEVGRG